MSCCLASPLLLLGLLVVLGAVLDVLSVLPLFSLPLVVKLEQADEYDDSGDELEADRLRLLTLTLLETSTSAFIGVGLCFLPACVCCFWAAGGSLLFSLQSITSAGFFFCWLLRFDKSCVCIRRACAQCLSPTALRTRSYIAYCRCVHTTYKDVSNEKAVGLGLQFSARCGLVCLHRRGSRICCPSSCVFARNL